MLQGDQKPDFKKRETKSLSFLNQGDQNIIIEV